MAIELKHSGNAAAGAVSAYGGGQAKRRVQDSSLALRLIQQKEQTRSNRRSLDARVAEAEAGREFSAGQSSLRREEFIEDRTHAELLASQSREREEDTLNEQRIQADRLRVDEKHRDFLQSDSTPTAGEDGDFEFSQKQRNEMNAMADAYDEAVSSGDYNEEELSEIRDQMLQKRLGIKKQFRFKKKSPWPQGQATGDTWTSDSGLLLTRDEKGNVKKLGDASTQPSVQDISGLYQQAVNTLTDAYGNAPSQQAIEKFVQNALDLHAKLVGGQTTGAEGVEAPVGDPTKTESPKDAAFSKDMAAFGNLSPAQQEAKVKAVVRRSGGKLTEDLVWSMINREASRSQ